MERCFVSSWDAEILCVMALGPPCKKFAFKNCYFQKRLLACFFLPLTLAVNLGEQSWPELDSVYLGEAMSLPQDSGSGYTLVL